MAARSIETDRTVDQRQSRAIYRADSAADGCAIPADGAVCYCQGPTIEYSGPGIGNVVTHGASDKVNSAPSILTDATSTATCRVVGNRGVDHIQSAVEIVDTATVPVCVILRDSNILKRQRGFKKLSAHYALYDNRTRAYVFKHKGTLVHKLCPEGVLKFLKLKRMPRIVYARATRY